MQKETLANIRGEKENNSSVLKEVLKRWKNSEMKKMIKFPQKLIKKCSHSIAQEPLEAYIFSEWSPKKHISVVHSIKNNIYELFYASLSDLLWEKPQQP